MIEPLLNDIAIPYNQFEKVRLGSKQQHHFQNGFLIDFKADIPHRRCISTNNDGTWLLYADGRASCSTERSLSDCFLYNPSLQLKVPLIRFKFTLKSFSRFLIRCYLTSTATKGFKCCYSVCFLYKHCAGYVWCTHDSDGWFSVKVPNVRCSLSDFAFYRKSLCCMLPSGLLFMDDLGVPSLNMYGNRQRRLVVCYGKGGEEDEEGDDDRLLLLERMPQCSWEVWELDSWNETWVSLSNLEGIVVFLGQKYSAAYQHRPNSGLVGNCICFTEDGDEDCFYVFSLADQTTSIIRNQPHSEFPAWFPNKENLSVPGLSLLEAAVQDKAIGEGPEEKPYEIRPLDPEECYARGIVYCQLPDDLQRLVAESLHSAMDYANYRLVCRKWTEIARPIRFKSSELSSTEYPWLMSFQENDSCISFVDPSCNMTYFKRNTNPELSGCKVRYSINGWLLVTHGIHTVFFFEPVSKTKICVPDLPEHTAVACMSFSSLPTSSDWIIIAVVPTAANLYIGYLRSPDKEWNFIFAFEEEEEEQRYTFIRSGCNLVFHDKVLYYLCQNGSLAIFHPDTITFTALILDGSFEPLSNYRKGYLVSCEYGLYLVVTGPMGKFVNLYKLETAPSKWTEVKVLPTDFSFFISQTSSFAVRVANKAQQNTINLPLFVENRHVSYKVDTSEFTCYGDDNSSLGLHERKELHSWTWIQPKLTRVYSQADSG